MLFGTVMTAFLPTVGTNGFSINLVLSLFLGVSAGAGLPSSLAYFADTTVVENRGRSGGIVWCAVGFSILGLSLLTNMLEPFQATIALAIWRAAGLIVFHVLSRMRNALKPPTSVPSYKFILNRRDVVFYLLPWIMFCLVNFAEAPILINLFGELQAFLGSVEFAITGFFAIVGGILADLIGRKRVVITGFVILGIAYAVLSLLGMSKPSWYVYTVCDGIAWGMFASVFFMTLWGDLAEDGQKEKYYVLGGLPYLLATFLPVLAKPFVRGIETVTAFSLASFFLFLAVLPLMYAPETLPEKKIREMELRSYAERAKKIKEKYA
jgi:MFS family permease